MKQIRKNIFETNSSSVHTLSYCEDKKDYNQDQLLEVSSFYRWEKYLEISTDVLTSTKVLNVYLGGYYNRSNDLLCIKNFNDKIVYINSVLSFWETDIIDHSYAIYENDPKILFQFLKDLTIFKNLFNDIIKKTYNVGAINIISNDLKDIDYGEVTCERGKTCDDESLKRLFFPYTQQKYNPSLDDFEFNNHVRYNESQLKSFLEWILFDEKYAFIIYSDESDSFNKLSNICEIDNIEIDSNNVIRAIPTTKNNN